MILSQYFVEFIFYSFLGWVWESIYCTIKEKKWADRGFLFGPVCPIYGTSVVAASMVFQFNPALSDPDFPIWGIFILCYLGSAVAEFATSWVLEQRFHARWWDYSNVPLNIQGRICVPVSVGFGVAGVLIVKYLIPIVNDIRMVVPVIVYEFLALVFAMIFGADFALTEVSLSELLKEVERIHSDFNEKAQANYEIISSAPKVFGSKVKNEVSNLENKVINEKMSIEEKIGNKRFELSLAYIQNATILQKKVLGDIQKFTPMKNKTEEQNSLRQQVLDGLKSALYSIKKH
ncbi:MAG: putative ABC transporter permease [Butyrivibrio sp.]|nr:putative ABC transporter permease [Butyrivibrio sp.]MBP3198164.1 putative ABC transporter permease [Butyrivibrio sp.]